MKNETYSVSTFGHGPGAHPHYRENQNKARDKEGHYADASVCCCYCGRFTGNGTLFAYLTGMGEFTVPEGREDNNDDLGMYPVGSDCAKKLRAAGVPLYNLTAPLGKFSRVK